MASSEGKKKKIKWKAVDATQIGLLDANAPRKPASSSWADESNDIDDSYDFGRKSDIKVALPTAPRAARGAENDANIPKEPPFQAYLSNLSYEVTENDLADFFANLRVKNVRLPRDDRGNTARAKGFGYVEFDDRNSLIEALNMPDTTCKGRRMRIEVAENGDQGRGGRGQRDRGPNEPDRTMGDWRSGPRAEAEPSSDRDGYRSGPRRDFDRGGGGMYRDQDRRGGGFRDDDRDRGGFRSRDGDRPGFRDNRGFREGFREERGGGFRDDRGGGFRDGGADRYERRGYDDRRGGDYGGDRSTWRRDPEPRSSDRERDREPDMGSERGEPKTRTKLNLQPRSQPAKESSSGDESVAPPPPAAPTSASIFGGARPVDTAAREREIEERLAKQREDRPIPSRDESRVAAPASHPPPARDPAPTREGPPASPPPLEPAPPPKENVWARRSQQPAEVNNGRISPHEDGETHKHRDPSPNNETRKYQPPRRINPDGKKIDDKGPVRGAGAPRGGGVRSTDTRPAAPPKAREQKKESADEAVRMPKLQEHQAPNFVASNKYAFLEDSETAAD